MKSSTHDKIFPAEYIQTTINALEIAATGFEQALKMIKTCSMDELEEKIIGMFGEEEWKRLQEKISGITSELEIKTLLLDEFSALEQQISEYRAIINYLSETTVVEEKK